MIRLTIPITYSEDVTLYLNQKLLNMLPRECWHLRLAYTNKIGNLSNSLRVNLTIDVIFNDWVGEIFFTTNRYNTNSSLSFITI